ncbi:hypothetical protein BT67DRAFT_438569 [Trichocladium antarcticum]|uniref:Phosphatidyl synthase n=1 Tax=Trichocladium antarcticum TaxID=1450529 RepID=A0AAN6UQE9_9PEZI|nr:hypothetical protein BT67DRAFT_438569 [Trichocladium antarcticum]
MLLTIRMAPSVGRWNRAGNRAAGSASGLAMALSGGAHPRWSGPGVSPGTAMKRVRSAVASSVQDRVQARRLFVSARRGAKEAEGKPRTGTEAKVGPGASSALRKMLPAMGKTALRENIYTIPNILTATRLVAAPFIGYCVLHDHHTMALGLFAYAGITDALDGWIARRWDLKTVVGTVIDPMADKTLMTILTVTLAMNGALPVWLAVIILGRDVGLAISAIYYRWISLPPPKTFARYWDFSLPSAEVRPTLISKVNTALQLGLVGLTTAAPVIPALDMAAPLGVMQYVVAATTIWSGASYIYSKDAVKILTPQPEKSEDAKNKDENR